MEWLKTLVLVLQVISAVAVIILVLLQQGKGASAGAAFGSGASGTVFGATGSANFLSRTTAWAATVFVVATIFLAFYAGAPSAATGGVDLSNVKAEQPAAPAAPAAPANPATQGIPK